MEKIKVLRVIARLNIGGPAIHAILLTEGLDKNNFESLLVCGNVDKDEGDMFYYAIEKNVKPCFIPELKRELDFLSDLAAFKKIYHVIKREKPHIIHTHTAKAGALGRLAGIAYNFLNPKKSIKLVHTFHGHIFSGYFGKLKTNTFILIEKFLFLFTNKVLTVSESVKKELISLSIVKKNKIEVIDLGFELSKFLDIAVRDSPILNIGIVGRLVPIKNHLLFLESAAKVINDNPATMLKFKIIGDGQLRKDLEKYSVLLGITDKVDFLGWQREIENIYSNLDIVVLTSNNEGTPVSLIEALASAKAVVATNVGGVKDLLGDEINNYSKSDAGFKVLERGLIVIPGNSNSFAAALTFILKNSDLRRNLGLRGRAFVKSKFSKEHLVKNIERIYYDLFRSNKPCLTPPIYK